MTPAELRNLVEEIRQRQSELDDVGVKTAKGGTPKRIYESLSAFAHRPGGKTELDASSSIILAPLNAEFSPIILEKNEDESVKVIAEYLATLGK